MEKPIEIDPSNRAQAIGNKKPISRTENALRTEWKEKKNEETTQNRECNYTFDSNDYSRLANTPNLNSKNTIQFVFNVYTLRHSAKQKAVDVVVVVVII